MRFKPTPKMAGTAVTVMLLLLGGTAESCEGQKGQGDTQTANGYTRNACDKTWRFNVAGTLYKQDRRDEVWRDASESNVPSIRGTAKQMRQGSTTEGSAAQKAQVSKFASQMDQLCRANGWKPPR